VNDTDGTDPGEVLDSRLAARLAALAAPPGSAEAAAVAAERERIRQLAIRARAVTVSATGRMMPFEELLRHSPEENAELLLQVADREARSPAVESLQAPRPVVRVLPGDTPAETAILADARARLAEPEGCPIEVVLPDGHHACTRESGHRGIHDFDSDPLPDATPPVTPLDTALEHVREARRYLGERNRYRKALEEIDGMWDATSDASDETAANMAVIAHEALEAAPPGAEVAAEMDKGRDMIGVLTGLCNMYVRGLYAAWIDAQRGDLKAVIECLAEGLDGFEGPEWNGTETGTEWHDRTAGDGDA
jgi:hypothetical protein